MQQPPISFLSSLYMEIRTDVWSPYMYACLRDLMKATQSGSREAVEWALRNPMCKRLASEKLDFITEAEKGIIATLLDAVQDVYVAYNEDEKSEDCLNEDYEELVLVMRLNTVWREGMENDVNVKFDAPRATARVEW
jgi:hypothetical protein